MKRKGSKIRTTLKNHKNKWAKYGKKDIAKLAFGVLKTALINTNKNNK